MGLVDIINKSSGGYIYAFMRVKCIVLLYTC